MALQRSFMHKSHLFRAANFLKHIHAMAIPTTPTIQGDTLQSISDPPRFANSFVTHLLGVTKWKFPLKTSTFFTMTVHQRQRASMNVRESLGTPSTSFSTKVQGNLHIIKIIIKKRRRRRRKYHISILAKKYEYVMRAVRTIGRAAQQQAQLVQHFLVVVAQVCRPMIFHSTFFGTRLLCRIPRLRNLTSRYHHHDTTLQ